mgnify:CR=1 FL=1
MYSFITDQIIGTELYLEPIDLNRNIDNIILLRLKQKYEGLCYENGIIIKDTIELIQRNMGKILTYNNKSIVKYNIKYKAKIISPTEGEEISIYVNNINKMGIIGYIKIKEYNINDNESSPLIIIVPLEYIQCDINDIKIEQKIKVIILGKRIKINSEKIQIVGELKNE